MMLGTFIGFNTSFENQRGQNAVESKIPMHALYLTSNSSEITQKQSWQKESTRHCPNLL
jgi:hypothetical protein